MVGFCKNAPKDEEWLREEIARIIYTEKNKHSLRLPEAKPLPTWDELKLGEGTLGAYNLRLVERYLRQAKQIIATMKEGGWVSPVEHKEALSRELAAGYRLAVDFTKGGE